mmetsp:Transcript_216/g.683  ORF Transcript_216/g.683 Transcript_216/m.683 type:complete len:116 (+) Transcript_216:526-873(+)
MEIINAGTQPLQNLALLRELERLGGAEAKIQWVQTALCRGLKAAELLVSKHGGKYAVGDRITLADAFLIPQIEAAESRFDIDVTQKFPSLHRIRCAVKEEPAFVAARPENQPDAP